MGITVDVTFRITLEEPMDISTQEILEGINELIKECPYVTGSQFTWEPSN